MACLLDNINDINSTLSVCVLVYVVCIEGVGTTEKLLSMNILAVINFSCQKDI